MHIAIAYMPAGPMDDLSTCCTIYTRIGWEVRWLACPIYRPLDASTHMTTRLATNKQLITSIQAKGPAMRTYHSPPFLQPVREAVSYRGLFTVGWFGVREKYCS